MDRSVAVHEAMVALHAPPPLGRLNVWLCVMLAVILVGMLLAAENGGIRTFLARIKQALARPPVGDKTM